MAIVITKVDENLKYVFMDQLEDENPFAVFVTPLFAKELLLLEDKVVRREGEEISFAMGAYSFNICKASITGWENINDEDGKPIEFKKSSDGIALDNTVAQLGVNYIQELGNVITAISRDKSKIQLFFNQEK